MKPSGFKVGEIITMKNQFFRVVAITKRGLALRRIKPITP